VEQSFLTLTASDGNEFAAYFAAPAETPRCGVVILPDVSGLHPYYAALADRFAEAGLAAVAYDFYARSAGVPEGFMRAEDFVWEPHRDASTQPGIDDDALARERDGLDRATDPARLVAGDHDDRQRKPHLAAAEADVLMLLHAAPLPAPRT
jgi:carboxymethylenebutenolidase